MHHGTTPQFQALEPRLFFHTVQSQLTDAAWAALSPAEIDARGLRHDYEHYLADKSIQALGGREVVNANPTEGGAAPEDVGQWTAPTNWPRVAVHAVLLPTGKVLFWDYNDNPTLWDPTSGQITNAAHVGYNIFCTGHNLLADGRVLVAGGHVVNGQGLNDASIYDPFNNTWQRLPDMNNGRWYPTNTTLANGDTLVVSGSFDPSFTVNQLPQVWAQGASSWRNLTGAQRTLPLYPHMYLAPNGNVFLAGESVTTRYLNTSGSGAWATVGNRVFASNRNYGSSVMYDDGKILVMGGNDPPTATAEVINLNAPAPSWRLVDSLDTQRRQINATILADGQVLVTGGTSGAGFNNTATAVYTAELWNPVTEQFTPMASMQRPRWYHSTAMLLPDGRVLSSGGDDNPTTEIYSPPYLFRGPRPTITSAPGAVGYGQSFSIDTPDAASIANVHLIRLGSVTHSFNFDQRINRLGFTQTANGLQLTAPSNPNLTPPGYYMLFVVNGQGVPSVAKMVKVVPSIAATATDAEAAEEGGNTATFTVTRTGSTIGAMTFPYVVSGTAANGADYASLSGSVTIPDGQSSATITVAPFADALMEGTESVTITLQPGSLHVVAPGGAGATATIADTPPKVTAAEQVYRTLPHALRFDFTRDVSASLSVADIVVRNLTTNQTIVPDELTFDANFNRATFSFADALPDGNYRATLVAAGITDAMGTPLAQDYVLNFHFLRGDANHDGSVDLADFNILAGNFGQDGRDFSQGDFNYDGGVDLADFNLLAGRFGTQLVTAPSFARQAEDDEHDRAALESL
jgi:hypothetical protein